MNTRNFKTVISLCQVMASAINNMLLEKTCGRQCVETS